MNDCGRGLAGGTVSGLALLIASANSEGDVKALLHNSIRRYQQYCEDESLSADAREMAKVFLALLEDPLLSQTIEQKSLSLPLHEAVRAACSELSNLFEESRHQYLRDRAKDILNLAEDIIGITSKDEPCAIWLVPQLTPSVLFAAQASKVAGIVCSDDVPVQGHLAILARGLGIALVANYPHLIQLDKKEITIHGQTGLIEYGKSSVRIGSTVSSHNNPRIWLNASSSVEVEQASGFFGVGLLRTEFLYLKHNQIPSLQEELDEYIKILRAAKGRPVIFRLLDFGADKPMPGLRIKCEANPLLGQRGIRLLQSNIEILDRQLNLLVRASHFGDLRIMVPMVTVPEEVLPVRARLASLAGEHIPLGAMVETPAAALLTKELCQVADFLSIGTNDLAAYIYATDRFNELTLPDNGKALLRIIKLTVAEAKRNGINVGVCGEIAANAEFALKLVACGCDYLSVVAPALQTLAQTIV